MSESRRKLLLLFHGLFLAFSGFQLEAQSTDQVWIQGEIDGRTNKDIYLQEYEGYRSPNVDTVATNSQGQFTLDYTPRYSGLHRLLIDAGESTGEQVYIDLILDGDSVIFQCGYPQINQSLRILKSAENQAFHDYLSSKNELDYRQAMLRELLEKYPVQNNFTQRAKEELKTVKRSQKEEYSKIIGDSSAHPITTSYMRLWHQFEQLEVRKDEFWKGIDFSSPLLLRTNVVSQKILDYFRLYQNETGDTTQMKRFIDGILDPQKVNPPLWQNSFDYLRQGFAQMGSTETLQYLKTKLEVFQSCETPLMAEIENEIQTLKGLELGQTAPDILLPDEEGRINGLSERERIILIFWSPDCPHCQDAVQSWRTIAASYSDYKLITVAIYNDKPDWQQFVKEYQLNFSTNLIDTTGWEGELAKDYRITRTPTYFVLSAKNEIIAKPGSLRILNEWLSSQ